MLVSFVQDSVRQLAEYKRILGEECILIVSCIRAEYKIEYSGFLSNMLSSGNYLCCGLVDSSLLHVCNIPKGRMQ